MAADHRQDTIVALSSGAGRAAIAVVRISGILVPEILKQMNAEGADRRAELVALKHPRTGKILDQCLSFRFEAPKSYTGEDVAEFHLHGSRAVSQSVLDALCAFDGVRLAEPGEFTRRALENGKLSLLEAEAVGDLIDSDVATQQNQALHQLFGHSEQLAKTWRETLIGAMAYIEANLDFVDESDVEDGVPNHVWDDIAQLRDQVVSALRHSKSAERIRDGVQVALVGPPNAGKSSLLNQLARREVAIVSPIAGTTRDIVEVQLDIDGFAFTIRDTAGLRETDDAVEQEGVRRAQAAASEADIVVLIRDVHARDEEMAALPAHDQLIDVTNKIDLVDKNLAISGLGISAKTGLGMDRLLDGFKVFAREQQPGAEQFLVTRARHKTELDDCLAQLDIALDDYVLEVRAEALRAAARSLGRLIGVIDHEQVLDQLFMGFCIGK